MARQWAVKRKLLYGGITTAAIAALVGIPAYFIVFHQPPTCSDGVQNQNERGVDCGGVCQRLCEAQTADANVQWARAFKVADGVYNAVAYVNNPNFNAGAQDVAYTFRLHGQDNVLITERSGTIDIPPRATMPVFVANIQTGQRTPERTFFSFTQEPQWDRFEDLPRDDLTITNPRVVRETPTPRARATVVNRGFQTHRDVIVTAVIFDTDGNAMAASQTVVQELASDSERDVVFTWQQPFSRPVGRIEVVPHIPLPE